MNRIEQFLQDHKVLILDGAMATELESKGLDLNDALWSAKCWQNSLMSSNRSITNTFRRELTAP